MEALAAIHRLFGRLSVWAVWAGGLSLMIAAFMVTVEVVGRKIGGLTLLLWTGEDPARHLVLAEAAVAAELGGWGIVFPRFRVPGSDEITGYVFAGATTWAYAYCLLHRSNIRIDALYNLLPTVVRALLDVLGLGMLLFYMGYFTWKAKGVFLESWANDSVSVSVLLTPLWIPQLAWLAGLVFFVIVLVFLTTYALLTFAVRGAASVQELAGTMSVQEEVAEETRGIGELEK